MARLVSLARTRADQAGAAVAWRAWLVLAGRVGRAAAGPAAWIASAARAACMVAAAAAAAPLAAPLGVVTASLPGPSVAPAMCACFVRDDFVAGYLVGVRR